jgi:DNA-binding beta-propeller fold protein YncE
MECGQLGQVTGAGLWGAARVLATLTVALWCEGALSEEPHSDVTWPGLTPAGAVLLPNGWMIKPAGRQTRLGDFPVLAAEHPSEQILAVLHAGYGEHEVIILDARTGKPLGSVVLHETFSGLVWSPDGKRLFVGGGFDDVIYAFDYADGLLSNRETLQYPDREALRAQPSPPNGRPSRNVRVPAGLALSRDGNTLWVANAFGHSIAQFDTVQKLMRTELKLETESFPYGLAWDEDRNRLYVSLWSKAQVAVVDTMKNEVIAHWAAQEHPNEMLLAHGGRTLYIANANRNTVSVFDTEAGRAIEVIGTAIDPKAPPGSTPSSLSLTPDEKVLFVANANTNDIAVVSVEESGASVPMGFIPVGWYPTSVRVSRDGALVFVTNGKGATSRANRDGPRPGSRVDMSTREYIAGLFRGTLSTIEMPGPKQMAAYSATVYGCSPLKKGDFGGVADPATPGNPIPTRPGRSSPITHCVFIIKENRTYDQVFGDIPKGNGEPSLCLFPEAVTPNHHALAHEFVLLDNFYVESEVSADGHEWSMAAYATDFVERTWPLNYRGDRRVPYPSEGGINYAIAKPAGGYLWDRAAAHNVSYRSYGEFIQNGATPESPAFTNVPALQGHFDPKFHGYDLDYPDQKRADRFLVELAEFEQKGDLPRLIILRLPNDHTSGTAPGKPTVTAYLADNDLALGRVIEALTKSRFWNHLAIFVVEDDAQNGSDHVDAHRTVALAISPYIKRKSVDSTMYSTSSMLRTIELCLGLDPMSQFDAAARPMFNAFSSEPIFTPFEHRPAHVDLGEKNLATAWGAEISKSLNLEIEDRADDLVFNEIIWKAVKGADSPMPPPVRAAFAIPRK